MRRRCGLVVGLLAVLTLVSGCAAAAEPDAASDLPAYASADPVEQPAPVATPAVPGMSATAVRLRTDVAIGGQFQTRISNTGTEAFSVLGVSLGSPGFEHLPFAGRPATYQPGTTIDLPTQYGPAILW